jgi:hypothetical protein
MKATLATAVLVALGAAGLSNGEYVLTNELESNPSQVQNASAIGGGFSTSDSDSDSTSVSVSEGGNATGGSASSSSTSTGGTGVGWSDSSSNSSLSLTTISNVKTRTSPIGTYPPYLPNWNHGGWGTLQAYFPNGPTNNDRVYERTFDPQNDQDMTELRGVLCTLPYDTPFDWLGGLMNGVTVIFGGPDNYHHGRGFDIANSVIRTRRADNKPMWVFIDSTIDGQVLADQGYAYVGRISVEGKVERSWDLVYDAAVAEAMPWDVDILLISGGMKGVTVGSTLSLPSLSAAYSQTNYSLSAGGGYVTGITEGKGKAVVSASAYRFCPDMLQRRRLPTALYERIRIRPKAAAAATTPAALGAPATAPAAKAAPVSAPTSSAVATTAPAVAQETADGAGKGKGIEISKELYQMAGFSGSQPVTNMAVR